MEISLRKHNNNYITSNFSTCTTSLLPSIFASSFENIQQKHFAAYTFHNLIIGTSGFSDEQTFDSFEQENTCD